MPASSPSESLLQSESEWRILGRTNSTGPMPNEEELSTPAHAAREANRVGNSGLGLGEANVMGDSGEVNRMGDSGVERVGAKGVERVDDDESDEKDDDDKGDDDDDEADDDESDGESDDE